MAAEPDLACLRRRDAYSAWVLDRLRATDLDYQGHVNNTVHAVLCANGRYDFLRRSLRPYVGAKDVFALARITIEYLHEMHYPGEVEVGTLVLRTGRSSTALGQGMFYNGKCAAVAESILVLLDAKTHRAKPWPAAAVEQLARFTPNARPASDAGEVLLAGR